ncbi:MAG: DNA repair exonuclease [Deltaproteobacteria bacterium]|nr:DNA repair exonuclease [Deltaproteobacteria bacterium]MBW1960681.1 DNA repair exonuclease [Deltaproteobacteria bacterium]MBW2152534.1 DNA repair exonuclease [Deltaproteobacteria bacterium]
MQNKMKILLTSDVHLGMKFAGYPSVQDKLIEARFEALKRCVDIANDRECGLFVIGGDLFDRVSVAKADIKRAADILSDFQGRLVAVLPGNHDFIIERPDGLWAIFKGFADNHVLVLESNKIYSLKTYDLDVNLYAAPCETKHSAENNIGWVRDIEKDKDVAFHIGVAHGSLEGLSPDFNKNYYPMTETELLACGVDLWLMGHTHIPYPTQLGSKDKVFYPGTPEPDGFDCAHEGKAVVIEIGEDKEIRASFVSTGAYRFYSEEIEISCWEDVERILARYSDPKHKSTLLKLKIRGRLLEEEYERLVEFRDNLERNLCLFHFDSTEITIKITPEVINREFTEGSFPYRLLRRLAETQDFEALQIAYEFIREIRR